MCPAAQDRQARSGRGAGGRGGCEAGRHTLVVPLPDGYGAPHGAAAVTAALVRQPAHLVRTLTWDQGREMARWADIETALGIEVFFCEPHSPWQRPINEQTNGLLRRWLPKRTPLDLNPLRLSVIEDSLNWMPRQLHNRQSAADIYTRLSRNHRSSLPSLPSFSDSRTNSSTRSSEIDKKLVA